MPGTPPSAAVHVARRQQELARVEQQQPLFRPVLTTLAQGSATAKQISRAIRGRETEVSHQLDSLRRKGYASIVTSKGGGKPTFAITSAGEIQLQLHQTFVPQETQSPSRGEIEF